MLAEKKGVTESNGGHILMNNNHRDEQIHIIVQVALRLFHTRGYARTSLSDIAKGSGLSVKDTQTYFPGKQEICHQVIAAHLKNQAAEFEEINHNSNPRQRLSMYLDNLAGNSDSLILQGCPMTNLYLDVRREDKILAEHAAKILRQRLEWVRQQFVLIQQVGSVVDLPERLTSAVQGINIMAQATDDPRLIQNQVNQLKSWIRGM